MLSILRLLLLLGLAASAVDAQNVEEGELIATIDVPEGSYNPALSHDGRLVAVSGRAGTAVHEVEGGKRLAFVRGLFVGKGGLALSPDGKVVVASMHDRPAVISPVPAGRLLQINDMVEPSAMAFSADGKRFLASGGPRGKPRTARLYDVANGWRQLHGWAHGELPMSAVALDARGEHVAMFGGKTLIFGKAGPQLHQAAIELRHSTARHSLAFGPQGHVAFASSLYKTEVRIFDAGTGKPVRAFEVEGLRVSTHLKVAWQSAERLVLADTYRAWIVDAATGKPLRKLKRVPKNSGRAGDFNALSGEGTRVAAVFGTKLMIWAATMPDAAADASKAAASAASAGRVVAPLGERVRIRVLSSSPDGKTVASCEGYDKPVWLWDVARGRQTGELESTGGFRQVWSPAGDRMAFAVKGGAEVWHVADRKRLAALSSASRAGVAALAWSPDGKQVLAASTGSTQSHTDFELFDAATGKVVRQGKHERRLHGQTLRWTPDGRIVILDSHGKLLELDPATLEAKTSLLEAERVNWAWLSADGGAMLAQVGKQLRRIEGGETRATVFGVQDPKAVSPDGRLLVSMDSWSKCYVVWDVQRRAARWRLPYEQAYPDDPIAFTGDGKWLVTAFDDQLVFWSVERLLSDEAPEGAKPAGPPKHLGAVKAVAWSGDLLLSGGEDGAIFVWDGASGALKRILACPRPIEQLAVSADGKLVAASAYKGGTILDLTTGEALATFEGGLKMLAYLPDGDLFVDRKAPGGEAALLDGRTGKEKRAFRRLPSRDLAVSPDGKRFACASGDGRSWYGAYVYDMKGARKKVLRYKSTQMPAPPEALAFSGDGKTLVAHQGASSQLLAWDVRSGKLRWRKAAPMGMSFVKPSRSGTADGAVVLMGSFRIVTADGTTVRLGHYSSTALSPDGKVIAVGGGQSVLRVVDASTGKQVVHQLGR